MRGDREVAVPLTAFAVILGVPIAFLAVFLVTEYAGTWWLALTLPAALLIVALLVALVYSIAAVWRGEG